MICDTCHGTGFTRTAVTYVVPKPVRLLREMQPCAECGGTGIVHCCEGLRAPPETSLTKRRD